MSDHRCVAPIPIWGGVASRPAHVHVGVARAGRSAHRPGGLAGVPRNANGADRLRDDATHLNVAVVVVAAAAADGLE